MPENFEQLLNLLLENIGFVLIVLFVISGLFGRKPRAEEDHAEAAPRPSVPVDTDTRSMAERLAEAMGMPLPTETTPDVKPDAYTSTRRNVQDRYPELFGGDSLFSSSDGKEKPRWGFDETEWGSTFERSEEQWGKTFPPRSSEPTIEWPNGRR